jgi:hypothetical protein
VTAVIAPSFTFETRGGDGCDPRSRECGGGGGVLGGLEVRAALRKTDEFHPPGGGRLDFSCSGPWRTVAELLMRSNLTKAGGEGPINYSEISRTE